MKAWYFSTADRRLRYGDDRYISPGTTHKVNCKPVLCNSGLHASKNIMDAISWSPGQILWQVELSGEVVECIDKVCATERTYLWGVDASQCLVECARKFALDLTHLWGAPKIVVQLLETGEDIRRDAAFFAAWDAYRTYNDIDYPINRLKVMAARAAMLIAQCDKNFKTSIQSSESASTINFIVNKNLSWKEALEITKLDQSQKFLDMVNKLPRIS